MTHTLTAAEMCVDLWAAHKALCPSVIWAYGDEKAPWHSSRPPPCPGSEYVEQPSGGKMNQITDWSHETVLAAEPTSASKARDFVCLHLAEHHLLYLVENIRLVASELATNAMMHAQTPFIVTLSRVDGSVLLAIRDYSTSVPVRAVPQLMGGGGRGLGIVELLSHEWGTSTDRRGSKSVWASFATRTRPGPSPVQA
jgi:anti-sigma regulatory factor (Ser/Thr protein kinase)